MAVASVQTRIVCVCGLGLEAGNNVTEGGMLDLNELANGCPAITRAFGQYLAEAGGVCLESQGHSQGVSLSFSGSATGAYSLHWPPVTEQVLRCLNDPEVATEHGAVGIAVLLVKNVVGLTTVERSRKGTGFDYWLGDEGELPFQNKARLEVSGIRQGSTGEIGARVKNKLGQVAPSDGTELPAYVVVVEFGRPCAEMRRKA